MQAVHEVQAGGQRRAAGGGVPEAAQDAAEGGAAAGQLRGGGGRLQLQVEHRHLRPAPPCCCSRHIEDHPDLRREDRCSDPRKLCWNQRGLPYLFVQRLVTGLNAAWGCDSFERPD